MLSENSNDKSEAFEFVQIVQICPNLHYKHVHDFTRYVLYLALGV